MMHTLGQPDPVCTLDELLAFRTHAARTGRRVVHCHGCFDIVHPGHVRHLQHARQLGDCLVVSVTADEYVAKGVDRPMFNEDLRAENVGALSCVDHVVVNRCPTAVDLLEKLRPDVYVKGAEYETNEDPRFLAERDAVERHGGRVVFSSGDVVFSSSALIEAMDPRRRAGVPGAGALDLLSRTHDLSAARIRSVLASMSGRRIVVVGESIIDTYVQCAWPEVTSEAPLLSLRPTSRTSFDGGAAVIARHAAALGADPLLITHAPCDDTGAAFVERLTQAGVTVETIDAGVPLAVKERFLVGREKLMRLDHSCAIELDAASRGRLVEAAASFSKEADAAIVADFGLGLLAPRVVRDLFAALRPRVSVLAGDVSGGRATLLEMKQADLLCPSERELRDALGRMPGSLPAVTGELIEQTGAANAFVTLAGEGVIAFSRADGETAAPDGQQRRVHGAHIPAFNPSPMDTLGCGDALLAGSVLAMAGGANHVTAAYVGSLAAACEATLAGNNTVDAFSISSLAEHLAGTRSQVSTRVSAARAAV